MRSWGQRVHRCHGLWLDRTLAGDVLPVPARGDSEQGTAFFRFGRGRRQKVLFLLTEKELRKKSFEPENLFQGVFVRRSLNADPKSSLILVGQNSIDIFWR